MSSIPSEFSTSFWGLANRITFLLLATLGVLLFSVSLFSQGSNGRILGTVTDQSGGVISGATITIIDKDRGVAATLTTDTAGEYNAPQLLPGTYIVRAEANGFRRLERQNVLLEVGKEVRVDLTVQPGEQTQTVTVTEAIPLVETTNATLGGTLQNADINDLPLNGRNYQSLLGLRPGVLLQRGGSPWTQSTNNVRPDQNGWFVDGVLDANFFDAQPIAGASSPFTDGATILPVDAIQEFNLEENPKAEFGGKPGAVVNVGLKSGTNNFHGAAYAFGRDGSWSARNFFNPAPNPILPLQLEQFGGVVGGPIKKDKLFFFLGYEGLRDFLGNSLLTSTPETASQANNPAPGTCSTPSVVGDCANSMVDAIRDLQAGGVPVSPLSLNLLGCPSGPLTTASTCTGNFIQGAHANSTTYLSTIPNTNTSDNGIAKIDYRVNDKHSIHGSMFRASYTGVGEDFPQVNTAWGNTVRDKAWQTSGGWIWTATSSLVNEFRMGYTRWEFIWDPNDVGTIPNGSGYPINTGTGVGGFPAVFITSFRGFHLGSQPGRPLYATPNPYYDFQDSVSYLRGKHALKFGFEFSRIEGDGNPHDQRGRVYFDGGQTFCTPGTPPTCTSTNLEDFFAGLPSRGQRLIGTPSIHVRWNSYQGFFQDDWRIVPKLMLNLGLRYAYNAPFHEVNNILGNFDPALGMVQQGQSSVGNTLWKPDRKNWSPRVGFAWDVTGKGTTVVRGGAGVFYDMLTVSQFTANPGINNVPGGTSLSAVPTGACNQPVPIGGTCSQVLGAATFGGTVTTSTIRLPGGALNWDPALNPSLNGGVVFPQAVPSCTAVRPCSISAIDPRLRTPYTVNFDFGVQHAFTSNLSLEVEYVGNHGGHLMGSQDINAIDPNAFGESGLPGSVCGTGAPPPGPHCEDDSDRPFNARFPYLRYINYSSNIAHSNYNSLQTTLTQRLSHGLSYTVGYTYGHGLDNGSLNRFGPQPQNPLRPDLEYASSDFDIRHRASFTASYDIPGKKGYGQLLEGWKLNTIVTISGAQPWNIIDSSNDFSGTGETNDRWDFFGNPPDFKASASSLPFCAGSSFDPVTGQPIPGSVSCSTTSGVSGITTPLPSSLAAQCAAVAPDPITLARGGCYVKGNSVMVPPKLGGYGTMGRNIFRDTGFKNVDFSVFKSFTFKERFGAQFRAEFFNVFNHPILTNPFGGVTGGNVGGDPSAGGSFGCGCGTPDVIAGNPIVGSGSARQIQLALKLTF